MAKLVGGFLFGFVYATFIWLSVYVMTELFIVVTFLSLCTGAFTLHSIVENWNK
jgi:hypothetical protein